MAAMCLSMLVGCAKSDMSMSSTLIPVPIHGVNYTAEPFSFVVIDPQDRKNYGGGELINSYGAGGTVCCYTLPAKWRPSLKVEITETYWLPMKEDKSVPEIKRKHVVEVPRYLDREVGELWVLREIGGKISIVSSNYQPVHPD